MIKIIRFSKIFFILITLNSGGLLAQQDLNIMPWPSTIKVTEGNYRLAKSFQLSIQGPESQATKDYSSRLIKRLARRTGIFFEPDLSLTSNNNNGLKIAYEQVASLEVGVDESYNLNVSSSSIELTSATQYGVFRGLETLLQLLGSDGEGYFFYGRSIEDKPRFVWRGLLLDVCRHWMPLDVVLRNIDAMAAVKMNVLHLHLTEDQGFRIESKKFPKLHQMGSDGNYFTQEEIKYIVKYASDRGIRIIPEFDIPGHATSWFVGYPELASAPGPYEIAKTFGVQDPVMDPTKETTYEFLEVFLTEMSGLFPDKYIHIGGDENNGKQWDSNKEISKFKEENYLDSNHELQAYFNLRISKILDKLGKRMVGWDEIAHDDLPKSIVIQSWRGKQALADAAEKGYDVLLSNGYYIDLVQPASFHYSIDPLPEDINLSSQAIKHVLGGEATMWSELVTPETVDSRIWPRTAAIAERLWSPAKVNDPDNMYLRMGEVSIQLEEHGLLHKKNYEMMIRRLAGKEGMDNLRILIDVIEPIEGYKRHSARKYTTSSPLTRVPDIAQPDAVIARNFNNLVERYLKDGNADLKKEVKAQLLIWVNNHKQLKMYALTNPQIREILPMSNDLSRISVIGIQAMSDSKSLDKTWKASAISMLKSASNPKVECEIKVVDGILKLVSNVR